MIEYVVILLPAQLASTINTKFDIVTIFGNHLQVGFLDKLPNKTINYIIERDSVTFYIYTWTPNADNTINIENTIAEKLINYDFVVFINIAEYLLSNLDFYLTALNFELVRYSKLYLLQNE